MADDPRGYQALETRIGRVRFLLDNWDVIFGPFVGPAFGGSGSGLPPMLSKMAHHGSVRELDRCLHVLERTDTPAFRHLKAYRCDVEWRCVDRSTRVRRPRGKGYEVVVRRIREPLTPAWVSLPKVEEAERRVVAEFNGEVFVPDELWNAYRRPAMAS